MRALAFVAALVLAAPAARATYECGGLTDSCNCGANDPYPCCDYGGRSDGGDCTWLAWREACCGWGVGLPGTLGNANTWASRAAAHGWTVLGNTSPQAGTVATSTCGGYGHVAWVTQVYGGGRLQVHEENCGIEWGADYANYDYGGPWCSAGNWNNWPHAFTSGYISHGPARQCNPGDSQVQGCGLCGTQRRGCDGNGQWGGWSGCSSEGECAPGQQQTQACCDCGSQTRSCDGACHWTGFGACEGPDPAGQPSCQTGRPGVCADGAKRCVHGCLACVELRDPSPETCDGLDDDCNGQVDEGEPKQLGTPPPAFAASIVDASYPRTMKPGESADAWVELRNDGTESWKAGAISLRADGPAAGKASLLAPPHGWPAFDTAAVLDTDVPPGGIAVLRFPIRAGAPTDIDETFTLTTPAGAPMQCPEPTLHFAIATLASTTSALTATPAVDRSDAPAEAATSSCRTTGLDAFALLVALVFVFRRKRA